MAMMRRVTSGRAVLLFLISMALVGYWIKAEAWSCRPTEMSAVEAKKIKELALAQGKSFRQEIDDARERGISLETDTTLEDILSDPDQTLARAKDLYERRGVTGAGMQLLLDQGWDLDDALLRYDPPLLKRNNNYFSELLDSHLQMLAQSIGGKPTDQYYRIKISPKEFVFALEYFVKGAELSFVDGWVRTYEYDSFYTQEIQLIFLETWSMYRSEKFTSPRVVLSTNIFQSELVLRSVTYSGYDYITNFSLNFLLGNFNCLPTFSDRE